MRKLVVSLAVFAFVLGSLSAQAYKKYDIKSGIVTLDITMKIGKTEIKTQKVLYFDDYGAKQYEESSSNGKPTGAVFCDEKDQWALNFEKKTAKRQASGGGMGPRVELDFFGTKEDIASGAVKKMPPMTLAGQSCDVIQVARKGEVTIYGGWHRVLVYMKTSGSTMETETKAVKLEAVAVPKDKFIVPAGYSKN
jgi:hypothetical protein